MVIDIYYDNDGQMIHQGCGGIVNAWKDGSLSCMDCPATQEAEDEEEMDDDKDIVEVSIDTSAADLFDKNDEMEFVVTRFVVGRIDKDPPMLWAELVKLTAGFHKALETAGLELVPGKDPRTEVIPNVVRHSVTLVVRGAVMVKDQADG